MQYFAHKIIGRGMGDSSVVSQTLAQTVDTPVDNLGATLGQDRGYRGQEHTFQAQNGVVPTISPTRTQVFNTLQTTGTALISWSFSGYPRRTQD